MENTMSKDFDRKFDSWLWHDMNEATDSRYTFEVRITRPENVAEGPIGYYIKSQDPPLHVKAGTLEELRAKLDKRVRSWLSVEWQPKILVLVKHTQDDEHDVDTTVSLNLETRRFEEGKATRDGKLWWRFVGEGGNYDSQFAHHGSIVDYDGNLGGCDWESRSYSAKEDKEALQAERKARRRVIDDTPENRVALQAIQDGIILLAKKLDGLLSAETIKDTLANVRIDRLLSVGKEKP
jgi:hypothetical protein